MTDENFIPPGGLYAYRQPNILILVPRNPLAHGYYEVQRGKDLCIWQTP